jgi:DNA-directed RNA polymerase specialized sigma24 family protein
MQLTDEQAKYAWKVALNISGKNGHSTLGPEDFAAQAIEKLLKLEKMPDNLEGWLKAVITNLYIDRDRHINARRKNLGKSFHGHNDEEIAELVADRDQPSMSSDLVNVEFAREILESLPFRDQQIWVLHTAGYSTAEIAIQLDFANAQVVATKMGQIRTKLQKAFGSQI